MINPNNPPPQGFGSLFWEWVLANILFIKRRQNALSGGGSSADLDTVLHNGNTSTLPVVINGTNLENTVNKATDLSVLNNTLYPTTNATNAAILAALSGITPSSAVDYATDAVLPDGTTVYSNGTAGVGATLTAGTNNTLVVDGHTFTTTGERVLVKNQAAPLQNGVYTVTNKGTGATKWILTRATDYDTATEINNSGTVPVIFGTANTQTSWLRITNVTTIGTDPISYAVNAFTINSATIVRTTDTLNVFTNQSTSAMLRNIISDETGGGVAVFADTPTINNPTLDDATLSDGGTFHISNLSGGTIGSFDSLLSFFGGLPNVQPSGDILQAMVALNLVTNPTLPTQILVDVASTSFTINNIAYAERLLKMTANTLVTVTVLTNAAIPFTGGTHIDIMQVGTGKVIIQGDTGVTILSKSNNKSIAAQYVGVTLIRDNIAVNTWFLIGDLLP